MAWAKAILDGKGSDISDYLEGSSKSKYGVGHTLIHVPLVLVSRKINQGFGISCEGPIMMFAYEINALLSILLI
jgi:hypothetical protein